MNVHCLMWDSSRTDLVTIVDYVIDDFDATVFWRGETLDDIQQLSRVTLLADSDGELPDLMGNPLSWHIVSARLKSHVEAYAGADAIQFIPVVLTTQSDGRTVGGFDIMNVTQCVSALDGDQSSFTETTDGRIRIVHKFVLRASALGGLHVFRLTEFRNAVFFSDELARSMNGCGFKGVAFLRCDVV